MRSLDTDRTNLTPTGCCWPAQDLNLALKEAAKGSSVNSRTIRASERGVSVPATETLIKLAKAYDKPLSWFMSDDHSTQSHEPKGHGNEATA